MKEPAAMKMDYPQEEEYDEKPARRSRQDEEKSINQNMKNTNVPLRLPGRGEQNFDERSDRGGTASTLWSLYIRSPHNFHVVWHMV